MMMRAWTDIVGVGTALSIRSKLGDRAPTADEWKASAAGPGPMPQTLHPTRYLQAVGEIHAFGRADGGVLRGGAGHPAVGRPWPSRRQRWAGSPTRPRTTSATASGREGIFAYSPFCAVFNASGQPAASLPLGWSSAGLPIGVHLAAAFGADEDLIALVRGS